MSAIGYHHTEQAKAAIAAKMRGRRLSEATKAKISRANRGRHHTEEWKQNQSELAKLRVGPLSNRYGKYHTSETRSRISKTLLKGKPCKLPCPEHLRWKHEWTKWRLAVLERDEYTCQKCGLKGVNLLGRGKSLEGHHLKDIRAYPDLVYEVSNGITFCRRCHNGARGRK